MSDISFKINHQIQTSELRVLDSESKQIGILSKAEALKMALEAGLDLVEIAPNANPPVAKIIDYKKLLYQIAKKEQAAKAAAKKVDLKEVQLTPFMAQNDFDTRINKIKGYLEDGHKVRLSVKFKGRQLTKKEFGPQMTDKALAALVNIATIDQPGKWFGKIFTSTLTAAKKSKS